MVPYTLAKALAAGQQVLNKGSVLACPTSGLHFGLAGPDPAL
jgi:hypothetical protein